MLGKILFISSVLLIAGCGTTKPVITTVTQRVEVPVPVPCKVEMPARPDFNFEKLSEDLDIFEKVKAILADLRLHRSYEEELVIALKSCK